MTTLKVHHGAWVLVGDGKKALFLNNEGDAELLNLRRISVREQVNPATHLQGTDAPGRGSASSGTRFGSMGETDCISSKRTTSPPLSPVRSIERPARTPSRRSSSWRPRNALPRSVAIFRRMPSGGSWPRSPRITRTTRFRTSRNSWRLTSSAESGMALRRRPRRRGVPPGLRHPAESRHRDRPRATGPERRRRPTRSSPSPSRRAPCRGTRG